MNKEAILRRINELEKESQEMQAEQEAIKYLLSVVCSKDSSRADEIAHQAQRRQAALDARISNWLKEISALEQEVAKLAA